MTKMQMDIGGKNFDVRVDDELMKALTKYTMIKTRLYGLLNVGKTVEIMFTQRHESGPSGLRDDVFLQCGARL